MKSLTLLVFFLPFLITCSANAKKAGCSSCKALQEVKAELSQKINSNDDQKHALMVKTADVIEKAIVKMKEKEKSQILSEVVAVLARANSMDPFHMTAETAAPAYKENKKLFEKHLNKLPAMSQKAVRESLQMVLREESEGNG